jgi:hypothetical protein
MLPKTSDTDRDFSSGAVPRLALTRGEAAKSLGIGLTSFEKYVQPELRMIRRGSIRIVATTELERWIEENAERVLE